MIRESFDLAKSRTGQGGTVFLQDLFLDADYLTSHGLKLTWGCITPGMTVRAHQHDDEGLFIFAGTRGNTDRGRARADRCRRCCPGASAFGPLYLQ